MPGGEVVSFVKALFGLSPNPGEPTLITDGSLGVLFDELGRDARIRRPGAGALGAYDGSASALIDWLAARVFVGSSIHLSQGAGSPEGSVSAPVGSVYLRADGSAGATVYVKESGAGNTGWTALGAASSVSNAYTNGEAGPITQGQVVYISAGNTVKLAVAGADDALSRGFGVVVPASIASGVQGLVADRGKLPAQLEPGLTLVAGEEVFLSASVAGSLTNVAPAGAGEVIHSMGYLAAVGAYDGTTTLLATVQLRDGPRAVV